MESYSGDVRRTGLRILSIAVLSSQLTASAICIAKDDALAAAPRSSVKAEPSRDHPLKGRGNSATFQSNGVFDESYFRQLQRPMESSILLGRMPQANGWYSRGFPMHSYRWGYFGAERRYPRAIWRQGYYGDKIRAIYR
jgi:hypothetical protein